MDIKLVFDSSTSAAPSGFAAAVDYAASQLDSLITNNITVTISVSWDNTGAVLGEAQPNLGSAGLYTYATVVAALRAHAQSPTQLAAVNALPVTDPTHGKGVYLTIAQAEALGLPSTALGNSFSGIDGQVVFGTGGVTLNFSTTSGAVAQEVDFTGTAEHELTHALGRADFNNGSNYTLMDLYAYAAPGTLQSTPYAPTYFSIDGGQTSLAAFDTTSDISDWANQPQYRNDAFGAYAYSGYATTISTVDTTLMSVLGFDVPCFCPGTMILTPSGEVPVERLAIGDEVITQSGPTPIKWIGRSSYEGRFLGDNPLMLPVTFLPGALGDGLPSRPMRVSPGHGVALHGVLVPAWRLVNQVNVLQAPLQGRVDYLHLDLARHDLVVSDGCLSESWGNGVPRSWFQNASDYAVLYPGADDGYAPCAPRIEDGLALEALRDWVNRRAGLQSASESRGKLQGEVELAGPDVCAGWVYCQAAPEQPVHLLVMAGGEILARTVANQYRPDLRAAGVGAGCCGFAVKLPAGWKGTLSLRRASDGAEIGHMHAAKNAQTGRLTCKQ
ncbi:NF038122 family metalloprotease [Acidocella sp.]|uniref:NF038122 family metalloprotease n=1 Tax=Acidocella sp. TaxID=50710 RepID=UPI002601FB9E|nr:NF038122 family metalloprotease [Acidocella sp.]